MVKNRDQIYRSAQQSVGKFVFDEKVADVFEDMVSRSVPGYGQILQLLPSLVKRFYQDDGHYYDLGCSLGAGMLAIAQGIETLANARARIIGLDTSEAMLKQARSLIDPVEYTKVEFDLLCADVTTATLDEAAIVLMNFTLQFIPLARRDALIEKIYAAMLDGGALVISEKIKFDDPQTNQVMIDIHHQYKADQGYSQLEISQKRDAIEDVLIPEALETHINRLRSAGFKVVTPWIQNLQFTSILAIK